MASDFVTKTGRRTGKEYLDASLEDVIDLANKSRHESEIPFASVVLSAKASQDQKLAAKYTSEAAASSLSTATSSLSTAKVSLVIAFLSLCSPVLIYWHQSQQIDAYKTELTLLASKQEALSQKIHQSELDRVRLIEQVAALRQSQMITAEPLIKDLSKKN